ncbi:MAG: phosphatidylserine decarboxylase family protein [Pirellulales bacterium]
MSSSSIVERAAAVPLPDNIQSVQPGGGRCYAIELAWGRWRRWWLTTFRRGYVRRMAERRRGPAGAIPPGAAHEILDPRDLKYCRNRCEAFWDAKDDPFRWRERLPFARWGLAELQLMGWPLVAATVGLFFAPWPFWLLAAGPLVVLELIVYFFRDPPRRVPSEAGAVVAPADGKVVEIAPVDYDEFCGGPAIKIGIFLSIFNVHINRAPLASRVIELRYSPGEFLNALRPESAIRNENMWIGLETDDPRQRRYWVRQISGAIARRIVCDLRPGESVARGHKFGMIKLGSRTELVLPAEGLEIAVKLGEKIKAGATVVGKYS